MRWLRETKHQTYPQICLHFDSRYSEKYIMDVCTYRIRSSIKPKEPND